MIDCPALHVREHAKGYPFGEHVPRRIRMLQDVCADFPFGYRPTATEQPGVAFEGMIYDAWTNSYGAVTAVFPDGARLGVKPDEFQVIEWHDLT